MEKEFRDYLKQEISRRKIAQIPLDVMGRRIVLRDNSNTYSFVPGDWMPCAIKRKEK